MVRVKKTSGGRVYLRSIDERATVGDKLEVDEDTARYLCDERGDFERIEATADEGVEKTTESDTEEDAEETTESNATLAEVIDSGTCPWCDDYTGENVGQHASSAHPDEWTAYRED